MRKRITKIICAITASTFILGAVAFTGCSNYYSATPLTGDYSGEVISNGGFAVEKGNYIYFINGVETGTAVNDYGVPVKGAVYRVSKSDLKARNYSSVQRVVSSIAYSGSYDGGIFIYGDRIYYGTPSTAKNSEGEVQNGNLVMKSTKLDGTETMKEGYVQFPSITYDYRYVEEGGTVYLLYVATSETLYDESAGVTNLHSYNTATGKDTLLAYNVSEVTFDSEDKTNPRVYYTMNVTDYTAGTAYGYNQLYTVTASATVDKFEGKLSSSTVDGWNDDENRYINCGDLVLDGIGKSDYIGNNNNKTPFNYMPENDEVNVIPDPENSTNYLSYTYEVKQYVNDTVYYTRTTKTNDSPYLFALSDEDELSPIANNHDKSTAILADGSNAGNFKFVEVGDKQAVLYAESDGGISINYFDGNGKLSSEIYDIPGDGHTYYPVVRSKAGSATILNVVGNYLYYSVSGGNGYTINRVDYTGGLKVYNSYPDGSDGGDYQAVKILDLDASSSWYLPEILDNYLLFASTTSNMTAYNYIMVFDMNGEDGIISNAEIREINEQYEGIKEIIDDTYGDTDLYPTETYANLKNALYYAFYNGDYDYLKEYAAELNEALEEDADLIYSEETFEEYEKFLTPTADNEWSDYTATKKINGVDVYANNRDYYYAVLGVWSEEDKEAYNETLKSAYLAPTAEEEEVAVGWYDGLSTTEQAFFIIGMCLLGALVIGGGVWLTLFLIRRNRKEPEERRRRIKVDTTDDKNIDVYDYNENN